MRINQKRNPWTTLKTREIYKNPWIHVSERDVINPAGGKGIYGIVSFQNVAVGVLALDDHDRILLVGQYRYALGAYSWEIPEGGSPLSTSPLASAKRELKEETGFSAKKWSKLLSLHLSNSCTDERAEIFLARDLKPGAAEPEDTEQLAVKWIPLTEAVRLVESGKITDAISVAAILQGDRLMNGIQKSTRRLPAKKKSRNSQRSNGNRG